MKISAVTLAYNDETTIGGTIKCLKPFIEKHLVLISQKPYFGEPTEPDATEEIAWDLGCEVIKGEWKLDHPQRTLGNILLKGSEWVLTFDSDEMMTSEEIEKLIKFLEKDIAPAVVVKPEVYWFDTDHRLKPKPDYCPVIACKPHVEFTYIRNINTPYTTFDGEMHHLSWCKPKDILKKVTSYAHATDFNGIKWYEKNFINWQEGQEARLPDGRYQTIREPLPDELKNYLSSRSNAH